MAIACGMYPNLFVLKHLARCCTQKCTCLPLDFIQIVNAKSSDQTNAKRGNDASNCQSQAASIDCCGHLSSNDTPNGAKAYLLDNVGDTCNFRRPIAYEVAANDLLRARKISLQK